jgi:hypothetical protein
MVNWSSPAEIAHDGVAFTRLIHCLLGLYIWEWVVSLDFDWQYLTGKKTFRWPMSFYFLNRYCLLAALIGIAVALNVTVEIDCQALYTFNQLLGNAAIGLASINLSLRTMAVWSRRWYIVCPLVLVILGHWSLLLHGVLLKASWIPELGGCVITQTDNKLLAITFIYSMVFDFVVLILTGFKLFQPAAGRSRLVVLIFNDGLVYFVIAFLVNLLATIFMLLNLNPVMSIIANVPAAIASTIVAGRVVRRLNNFTSSGPEMYPTGSTVAFRSGTSGFQGKRSTAILKDGVHVHMETFESPSPNEGSLVEYDATGRVITSDHKFDPEAQIISEEFKRPPY